VKAGPIDQRFAELAREAREAATLSQGRLAKLMTACGFPWGQQTVTRLETGVRIASVGEAAALAVILHIDVSLAKLGAELEARELCAGCGDKPPRGFTCNTCGRVGS
jgi:transcriptional regulator with XRE-family HTH domain